MPQRHYWLNKDDYNDDGDGDNDDDDDDQDNDYDEDANDNGMMMNSLLGSPYL